MGRLPGRLEGPASDDNPVAQPGVSNRMKSYLFVSACQVSKRGPGAPRMQPIQTVRDLAASLRLSLYLVLTLDKFCSNENVIDTFDSTADSADNRIDSQVIRVCARLADVLLLLRQQAWTWLTKARRL